MIQWCWFPMILYKNNFWLIFWSQIYLNGNRQNSHRRFKCHWFHICLWFFSNFTFDYVSRQVPVTMWSHFCENPSIFMKSIECDRWSSFIAFSVHFNAYKYLQNLILWCWVFNYFWQNLFWRVLRTLPCFAWMLQVLKVADSISVLDSFLTSFYVVFGECHIIVKILKSSWTRSSCIQRHISWT